MALNAMAMTSSSSSSFSPSLSSSTSSDSSASSASAQRAVEEYSTIAEDYAKSKLHPWRVHVEGPSLQAALMRLVGEQSQHKGGVSKKPRVLELACGAGHYTHKLVTEWDIAESVRATDISPEMIDLAIKVSQGLPNRDRVEFHVADAMQPRRFFSQSEGPFDVVFAAYLLNYASDREQLVAMAKTIKENLHPTHGVFVTSNDGPLQPLETFALTEKYGFRKVLQHPEQQGRLPDFAPLSYEIFRDFRNPAGEFISFTNYRIKVETFEEVFREAGFSSFRLVPYAVEPAQQEFFRDFTTWAPVVVMEARV